MWTKWKTWFTFPLSQVNSDHKHRMKNENKLPVLRPHKLRIISNLLHEIAMISPMPIARLISKIATKFYYSAR